MKKYILGIAIFFGILQSCTTKTEIKPVSTSTSEIKLPYKAGYTTEFTNNVSDSALLTVLNSYKYWETGDMAELRTTLPDSTYFDGAAGFKFASLTDSTMKIF